MRRDRNKESLITFATGLTIPCLLLLLVASLSYILLTGRNSLAFTLFDEYPKQLLLPVKGSHRERIKQVDELPVLGPHLRTVNAPDAANEDDGMSLLDEAHTADKGGFLHVREKSGRTNYYGISMYHQLHCLKMLRERIEGKHVDQQDHHHQDQSSNHKREVIDDQKTPDHLIHCIDYISQVCSIEFI
jgi:hypothetical protein